ncbi:uncharacterized protein B0J16DRAFT_360609 [Fusarium flagelliforme]|uniref:uncharacterized protein n=1 Tax=Fusarium flagelliforme TaxID=2675880 RepID=UPI001E8D0254|nr:uncharacterized protein B0J16DRAFT_360609 [Fusarium flagelliforme]KAH7199034.1 hypothetical protein B0J16DRAFT_360609 [Fusarium flagelliforme]
MTAASLQSEPSAIHPYIVLSTYRLLVCQVCGFASVADEVATHLRTRHRDIQPQHRQDLVEKIKRIRDVFRSRDEIRRYLQYPTDLIQPIPYLAPPEPHGLKCRACGHIVRRIQKIQKHCAEKHQWINPRGRGRPAPNCHTSADELPWEEHIACQRFFPSREGSKWFQVNIQAKGQAGRSKVKSSTKKPQGTPHVLTSEASAHLQQVIDREAKYREALGQPRSTTNDTGTDTFAATSLWLDRTQWPSIYRGSRRDVLRALIRLPDRHSLNADYILGQGSLEGASNLISPREDEQKISCIMRALDSVIDRCEDTVRYTSHNLRCWLLSSRLQSRREIAFNLVAEKSSEIKYRRTQKQLLAFVLRLYRMPDGSRREIMNVKIKPEISTQLDQIWEHNIWNHLDMSKGTWPVMKRQRSSVVRIYSDPTGGQSIDVPLNTRACQGPGRKEGVEDSETDDENVEAWELEDDEDDEDDQSDYGDSGYYDDDSGGYTAGTHQDLFSGVSKDSAAYEIDHFLQLLFQLCITLSTEGFLGGQPSSTLLIYFSGILGFSADGQRFQLARQYCSKLSAMIYIQRVLFLEQALPLHGYGYFNEVRTKYMVLGSQYPLAELISLRDFGRNVARTEPPAMLFHWSNDGETISHGTTEALCDRLIVKDDITSTKSGHSFVNCPENSLENGLAKDGIWRWHALEEQLAGGLYTACGQTPRIRELLIYVWGGYMAYVICHHKAKRLTNREFYVYLVYLGADRRAQQRLQTRLLFQNNGRPWPTSHLTDIITKATLELWQQKINVRTYCQLAIAITEKHVREVYTPFNRHDDCSNDADINAVFAWQSGYRPLQRGITYGLDGAYPSRLQPLLLRCYEWASVRWHEFLGQSSKNIPLEPKGFPVSKLSLINEKRAIAEVATDHTLLMDEAHSAKRQKGSGPLVILSKQDLQSLSENGRPDGQDQVLPSISGEIPSQDVHDENGNLASINGVLYVLDEPRILICLLCKHAVRPGKGIEAHFRNMHKYTGNKLKAVLSKAILQLPKLGGFSCDYCENHHNQCKARHGKAG